MSISASAFTLPSVTPVRRPPHRPLCRQALPLFSVSASLWVSAFAFQSFSVLPFLLAPMSGSFQPKCRLGLWPPYLPVCRQVSKPMLLVACHPGCRLVLQPSHTPVCCQVSWPPLTLEYHPVCRLYFLSSTLFFVDLTSTSVVTGPSALTATSLSPSG